MRTGLGESILVTGTGFGVGKTTVVGALLRGIRPRIEGDLTALKWIDVGCERDEKHDIRSLHAERFKSMGCEAPPLSIAPYRLTAPGVPVLAAEKSGISLKLSDLCQAVDEARAFGSVLIEGSAALSSVASDGQELDAAEKLGAVVLLVASASDSVDSSVLAVLESCRRRALRIGGVVVNRVEDPEVLRLIRERAGVRFVCGIPSVTGGPDAAVDAAEDSMTRDRVFDALLDAVRSP